MEDSLPEVLNMDVLRDPAKNMEDVESLRSDPHLAVEGEGVCFRFGGKKSVPVLKGLDISVERGITYGLLGPSGCGKTTLLRCIVGRHKPNSGTIKIYGKVPGQKGFSVPGPGVGYMPQELALYPDITMEETLTYFGRVCQMDPKVIKDRISFLTGFLDIPDKKKLIKHLSGGQQRRVSFAVALIHKPPLLILDEPTVGVDPLLRKSIWNHLKDLAIRDAITIIITTHYVEEARQAHVVGLMRDGRLLAENNPELLILKFNAPTLEDVFLKLCAKDSESEKANPSACELLDAPRENTQSVLFSQQAECIKYNTITSNNGTGNNHYKIALLNTTGGQVAISKLDSDYRSKARSASNRMGALMNKNFLRLRRNIPVLIFQVFIPAFLAILFFLCVGGEPFDIPMAVVNLETDPSGKGNMFLQHISPHTIRQTNYTNLSLGIESVQRGENWGVVYIGPIFTDSMINRILEGTSADNETIDNSTIKIYLDMTNQPISLTIYAKLMDSFQHFVEHVLTQFFWNPVIALPPVVLGKPIYGDLEMNFTEFMAPGMILAITYIMAVGLSALSIIIEKKEGLLDRSWIAGVRSWEVLFSILLTLFIVMLVQVVLVLLLTFCVFGITCHGSLVWVIIAVILVGVEGISFGLLISSIANDENIAVMIAMGSFYTNLLLSGIIWPLESMPHYLRHVSQYLPLTLISNTMRSILSRGWNITDNNIWYGYIAALAWIFPVIILSSFFFRYSK